MRQSPGGTVTLLFTDLVKSTELLEKLGDDAYETLRRSHFALLRRTVAALGGREVKSAGDGLMVAFSGALDAVACAVAMQQAVHRHNQQQEQDWRLALRIGLHAGDPIPDEEDYFGMSVVVARRLCDSAAGGQILASELVRGLVGSRGAYTYVDAGKLNLKGIAEPVQACEVAWEPLVSGTVPAETDIEPTPSPLPLPAVLASGERRPFVGRKRELEHLQRGWDRAKAGKRQLVLLAGEPGIGKTRLAAELCLTSHAEGATVLFGRSHEEAVIPYQPFAEALRHYVIASPIRELRACVAHTGPELAMVVPALVERLPELSGLTLQGRPFVEPLSSDPEVERYRLFEAVTSLLVAASRRCPTIVVLDDLHWADEPTLLLLKHIVRSPDQSPLLLVGTYRETELARTHPFSATLADLRRERAFDRVSVKGLRERDVAAMLSAWGRESVPAQEPAGQPELPAALVRAVHEHTEGNPFFIEEVLAHLVEAGLLSRREDGWACDISSIEEVGIPEGVKQVIGGRLSRLSEQCNSVLTIASVIGREFDGEVLERVCGVGGERLLELLEEAVSARVLAEVPHTVGRYSFSHVLIRETLYEEPTTARRVRLHGRIGEALEEIYKLDPAEHLADFAYHFFEAAAGGADVDRAVRYAARAGERAISLLAYEEAVQHYRRAVQALELAVDDGVQRCELLLALGDAQWRSGDIPSARDTFNQAADIARKLHAPDLLARAALGFGARGMVVGAVDELLISVLEEALEVLGEADSALRVNLLARLADELYFSESQQRRAALAQEAVQMARRVGDAATLAAALRSRRLTLYRPEDVRERDATAAEILAIAEETGDKAMVLAGYRYHLIDLLESGDLPGARETLRSASQLAEELRDPRDQWFSAQASAMLALLEGRFQEGEQLAQEALIAGQRVHAPDAPQAFAVQLFLVRREQGRLAELEDAVKMFVAQNPAVPAWRCALTYLYAEQDRSPEARAELEHLSHSGFAELPHDVYRVGALVLLSEVCAQLDDADRAATLYDLLLPFARRNNVIAQVACTGSVARSLGILAGTMRCWDQAVQHFESALLMNENLRARPWTAESQFDCAHMLLTRGQPEDRTKAQGLLAQALSTARELGMERLAGKALALQQTTRGGTT